MSFDSTVRRREFLACAGAAAAVAADSLSTQADQQACETCGTKGPQQLDRRHFESMVGDRFEVHIESESGVAAGSLVLHQVAGHTLHVADRRPAHVRQEPFSLLFVQREGERIADAMHRIRHRDLGTMELLLQRVSNDHGGRRAFYEAVFG